MDSSKKRQKRLRAKRKKQGWVLKGIWVKKRHVKALKLFVENLDKKTPPEVG